MKTSIKEELERIRKQHGGILRPADIVEFARDQKTALHKKFTWDNSKAAAEHRLWEAREIISVHVRILTKDSAPVRAYVSLMEDRKKDGGGYRDIRAVLSSPRMRKLLLRDAIADMERFASKYRILKEVSAVVGAMDAMIERRSKTFAAHLLAPKKAANG